MQKADENAANLEVADVCQTKRPPRGGRNPCKPHTHGKPAESAPFTPGNTTVPSVKNLHPAPICGGMTRRFFNHGINPSCSAGVWSGNVFLRSR